MSEIDEIKSKLDVVDIVSEKVRLQRAGRNYKANCPFHSEKTPSFIVDPGRQSWRCFGSCGVGGDVFSFVMKTENMEFPDALRMLAQRTGVELRGYKKNESRDSYFEINKIALDFYKDALLTDEAHSARIYLTSRGVDEGSIEDFGLGYSPRGRDSLKSHLLFHDVDLETAVECGLLNKFEDGTTRDFFWGRLMFPIFDRLGRPAGFGARSMDDSMPKYINTAATPVFDKRSTLYGFHMAREAIRDSDLGVIVEGYMDVIAAHEYGYKNVVASMGTALTVEQVRQLKNLASTFVLALDQDMAGQEATLRSLESAWQIFGDSSKRSSDPLFAGNPTKINVVSLPEGKDPDEFIRSEGSDWELVVSDALPLMEYLIPVVSGRFDLDAPGGKGRVVESLAPILRLLDPFDREKYIGMLAEQLSASVGTVETALKQFRRGFNQRDRNAEGKGYKEFEDQKSGDKNYKLDEYTLSLIINRPELKEVAVELNPECFARTEDREIYVRWLNLDPSESLIKLLDPVLEERFSSIQSYTMIPSSNTDTLIDFEACIKRLERRRLQLYRSDLIQSQNTDSPPSSDLQNELSGLDKKILETYKGDKEGN
ncbi:MAG: DNA primase [SAR202 cluster bacterium]|jgi:DNA primase|nr:DNA primase [SAR202 cluster bacterium]HJO60130.1 DNA primase [SAR202 cluster bacterium]|tara:strand:+ start:4386 stop:6179 length:1794 start_codon:yes stop_codon:yes gene_type:complete